MATKTFGYARVSAKDQNLDRQIVELMALGIDERDIYAEKQSGKDFERPQYIAMKNSLREGDLVIVKSLDRLGRDYEGIMCEWRDITKEIKAHIRVLDYPLLDTTQNPSSLMGTFIADLVLQILSYFAQQERDTIRQRQREGIAIAKAKGKHLGRPKATTPDNWEVVISLWRGGEITAAEAMRRLDMPRTTFYRLLKK